MKSAAVAIPVYLPQVLIHGTCQSYKLLVNKCLQTETWLVLLADCLMQHKQKPGAHVYS